MAEGMIVLRPHHIDRFVSYYHQFTNLSDNSTNFRQIQQRYGKDFAKKLREFYDSLASGGIGEEYILVKNGLDTICHMLCPIKMESCSEPDSLSLWNGSGQVMQDMDLREGWLYPLEKFLEKVKQLYPYRNPNRR